MNTAMRPLALFLPLLIVACSSSSYLTYRPPGSTESPWKIEAKWNSLADHLTVKIDGQDVLDTGVGFFSGKGEAQGSYQGKKVLAQVIKSSGLLGDKYTVQIFVEGEMAGQFEF